MVDNLEVDVLRRLAVELLRRQPAVFADLVNGEMAVHGQPQPDPGASPPTADDTPDWCNCGLCRVMPTQEENKCCCRTKMACMSRTALFQQRVLDGNVLDLAMRYREDVLVMEHPRNNDILPTYCISAVCSMAAWPFRSGQSNSCTKLLHHCHQDKISFT